MRNLVETTSNNESDCRSCNATGCNTCNSGVSNTDNHAPSVFTRREFGLTIFSASAGALLAGCSSPGREASAPAVRADSVMSGLAPDLGVVQKSKGPIMTTLAEFYKMGPGPSSSHTMGPMRITYDFFQRISKLPVDKLKQATGLKVHLFGSLSATGKGHGTDRASLAGLLGKSPAECPPRFLDELAANPDKSYKLTIGPKTLDLTLKDVVFDATKVIFIIRIR